jgi:nucleotidyltransferase/DNA polymerase involved in DNA repair
MIDLKFWCDAPLLRRIDAAADAAGMNRSDWLREALAKCPSPEPQASPPRKQIFVKVRDQTAVALREHAVRSRMSMGELIRLAAMFSLPPDE